ncbi:hypothetical protein GCM10019016_091380 [Streptomyces prasinosporus]|uniref:Secreted protein n=1 Tax=Streptomyces prasinosporus TaxID=68256 RepID=A0ABP6U2Z6_9ACTN
MTGAALLYVTTAALVHHVALTDAAPGLRHDGRSERGRRVARAGGGAHLLHTVMPRRRAPGLAAPDPPARTHLRQAAPVAAVPRWRTWSSRWPAGALLPRLRRTRYLYPFLDVARHGYRSVLANALLLGPLLLRRRRRAGGPGPHPPENQISSPATGGLK